jgi:hypothetical protein
MNNFQIDMAFQNIKNYDVWYVKKGNIFFKGNEKFTIYGLHGVLAFYRFYILGCFG